MTRAPLIIIDGIDGAGKTTQAKLLVEHFLGIGRRAEYLHFPRYDTFFGKTIERFLKGEFGDINSTSPYLCSITYALDRQSAASEMKAKLEEGIIIVTDRFVSSNLAHQGGRFDTVDEQDAFVSWNEQLEYTQLGVLRESIVIVLDTPPVVASALRAARSGTQDMLEENEAHQQHTYDLYLRLAAQKNWSTIASCKDMNMRPIEAIQQDIQAELVAKHLLTRSL